MAVPLLRDYPARQPAGPRPIISVVTTVRNGASTLAHTIASLREQHIPELEYIVADAGSTDGTLDIIRGNSDLVTYWQSEPDRGISDGFNKGIALSTGQFVQLLNADDWLSPGQITAGIETLRATSADFVFGDLLYHDAQGRVLHRVTGDAEYTRRIGHTMPALNHPTVIVRRDAYERFGLFDLRWRYAMDYELLLRFHRAGLRGVYDPRMLGHMTLEGASDRNARAALREVRDIAIQHGQPRLAAHAQHLFRLLKGRARRTVETLLPGGTGVAIRHFFNRSVTTFK